jgi:uncharacterized membrane protein HdeD (DUF308 family)
MRYTALGIGTAFGLLYLTVGVLSLLFETEPSLPSLSDWVILLSGPFSLIVATGVAWKYEQVGGWWLLTGGVTIAILFGIRLFETPMRLLVTFLVYPLPMLIAGKLWLIHAFKSRGGRNPSHP